MKGRIKEMFTGEAKPLPVFFALDMNINITYNTGNKGKTSGSRIMFISEKYNTKILLHKPHPRKELLEYQIKLQKEQLEQEGLI